MNTCTHPSVTIYYRLAAIATRYEPAEYIEFAECDECGENGDPSDFPDAETSDEIQTDETLHGAPSEFYD